MNNDNQAQPSQNPFIVGDQFSGIVVSDYQDKEYEFTLAGKWGKVIQKYQQTAPDRICVGFLFLLEEPMRFRLDVLIPEDCTNARVALQDQELLGYFSPNIPPNPEPLISSTCQDGSKYSPLKPGEFQSINFRWQSADTLKFYFYFNPETAIK